MASPIEEKNRLRPSYPKYFLQYNPFHVSEALKEKQDAGDKRALFLRHVYQKEINWVVACIEELAAQPGIPRLWILKDNSAAGEHNISVIGGIFRSILRSESPRLFPIYAPLPVLAGNVLKEITHFLVDRFQEKIFQRCVYSFVYQELQELLESGRASEVLPEIDIPNLLERMNESEGEAIQDVLFPKKEEEESGVRSQESEEESEVPSPKSEVKDQESGQEEKSEVRSQKSEGEEGVSSQESGEEEEQSGVKSQGSEERESEERKQRELAKDLADFITEAAKRKQFGEQVEGAVEASVRHGFDKGYSNLSQYVKYRELIPGLTSLLLYVFEKIVVLIDQLDFWDMLEDAQKGRFMGALSEFEWLAQDKSILVFAGSPETKESMGEAFSASFKKQALDLRLSNLDTTTSIITEQQSIDILIEFLKSDPYRSQEPEHLKKKKLSDLYPFTEEGVRVMFERSKGDIVGLLDLSEELLKEGKRAGYSVIDEKFVKKVLK